DRPPGKLAAAEVLPDVLVPDRFVRAGVDRVQIAKRSGRVDERAVDGRRGSRAGEHEPAGRVIGKAPQLLAAGEIQHAELVADGFVPVEQIDLAVADGRATKAGGDG